MNPASAGLRHFKLGINVSMSAFCQSIRIIGLLQRGRTLHSLHEIHAQNCIFGHMYIDHCAQIFLPDCQVPSSCLGRWLFPVSAYKGGDLNGKLFRWNRTGTIMDKGKGLCGQGYGVDDSGWKTATLTSNFTLYGSGLNPRNTEKLEIE